MYSRTTDIWMLGNLIANYPDQLAPLGKHFLNAIVLHVLHLFMTYILFPIGRIHTAHLRQECHNSKFGIFELLV
jgi:hypothetical protein